ncbi:hypothetical protein EW026_g7683 [Hermanssonia centrifuga]|uniref:Uncharacterized protein n=1 Tax=Hermanssonia centrifuga TaxID=98765 RepID=A0A4S4K6Z7_9APHY|nr:hypothetical protein EW026_g7683 [Hermanssonia centrifuga]
MLKPQTPTSSAPSRNSVATSSSSVFPAAKRLAAAAVAAPSPAVPAEEPEEDELYDDDDNDEVFSNPSPSKSSANRSARQRIMSEPEDEDEDGDEEADEDEDSEGYDRVQREDLRDHENEAEEAAVEAEVASGLVMSQGSTAPNLAERLFEDVVPMEERVSAARPRVAEPEASTSTPAAPARTPGKQSKAKMLAKLEPLESIEKNFLITVEYDDGGEEVHNSTFKTKGRHIVGKVLLTALRTFGIEDAIDSLVLIREDVVGGKAVRRTYPCSLDETMANAGARPNARLAILIDEDEEDDE